MKNIKKENIIEIGFYVGLIIKALSASIEFMSGLFMALLNHEKLNRLILLVATPELREDPKDVIMNYFVTLGKNLSLSSQHAVAIYMLLHGTTKLLLILLLFKKKVWVYPIAVVIFGLFVVYEMYSFFNSQSVLMLIIIIIDAAVIFMIVMEYARLKGQRGKTGKL